MPPTTCGCAASRSTSASRRSYRARPCFVVEQNRDAQLKTLLTLETRVAKEKLARCSSTAASRSARSTSWTRSGRPGGDRARRGKRLPAPQSRRRAHRCRPPRGGNMEGEPCRSRSPPSCTRACAPTRSASPCATTRARCRRSAPAAATTRSPPPSCAPSTSWTRRRTWWRSCRGIGCSSKTPTYFVCGAHGFNSAHGRMPAIAPGANAANRDLTVHRHLRRRRLALDRPRAALPRDPPQREHALRHREQRRLRPDQGAVLRLGRRRLEEQARRAQRSRARSTR